MRKRTKRKIALFVVLFALAFVIGSIMGWIPENVGGWVKRILPASVTSTVSDAVETAKDKISAIGESGLDRLKTVYNDYASAQDGTAATRVRGLEIPSYVKGHQVVAHEGYTLSYNEQYEQPDWVAYVLTVDELNANNTSRTEDFREDPAITTGSAHLDDYRNSGYDRGHLCPSADRTATVEENSETFYLSNMSPQNHRFNAGLWLKAEGAVRDAARQYGTLYVVTGPVFTEGMKTIGDCKVAVPESFYKVLLVVTENGSAYAIGMICPQEYDQGNLKPYLCTVDQVEAVTGLDFFPDLEDSIETKAESSYDVTKWPSVFGK